MTSVDDDVFDRQKRVKNWSQEAVGKARVLVAGAGALGNEVVKLLVQLGVKKICVVDSDKIVKANLNRCIFFSEGDVGSLKVDVVAREAKKINPAISVDVRPKLLEELPENFYNDFDYAFGCLDNLGARLHLNAFCFNKMPLLDGGTTGFLGKMQVVRAPSSCVECGLSKHDYKLLWQKYSCVGEVLDFVDPKMPALPTATSIIASLQVNEFLKFAHGFGNPLEGKYVFVNGLKNDFTVLDVPKRKSCPVHP